ncbi:hypothetical protein EVAR_59396_1 [Eumeta japonica]|uniref:Uncharacterized protein n=1 Tax=Eumeta variegata TaxID=151549 RepID=A0A4C1YKX1_EUMVA|nr:hypothetical protein EVAR_59396_1 [Eumeta japonica]
MSKRKFHFRVDKVVQTLYLSDFELQSVLSLGETRWPPRVHTLALSVSASRTVSHGTPRSALAITLSMRARRARLNNTRWAAIAPPCLPPPVALRRRRCGRPADAY